MIVSINKKQVEIFQGATLADVVLAYSGRSFRLLKHEKLHIYDRFGNLTEPDGPAHDGQIITLKLSQPDSIKSTTSIE